MLTLTTHRLRDLFFAAGLRPTPRLLDLALPDVLVEACKVYYARSLGPAFKAPPPAGAEGDAVWWIDEQRLLVLVGRTEKHFARLSYQQAEDALDDLHENVEDAEVRQVMLKAYVGAVEFVTGLTSEQVRDLRAYAVAAGM